MNYEYVAVRHRGGEVSLMNRGWNLWMSFVWDDGDGSVMLMRKPKCGIYDSSSYTVGVPRMWTEAEIQKIAADTLGIGNMVSRA